MDEHTLRILEFDKIKDFLAAFATSPLGRRLARSISPMTDRETVRARQKETSEMRLFLESKGSLPLTGLLDIKPKVNRAMKGGPPLAAHDMLDILQALKVAGMTKIALLEGSEDLEIPRLRMIATRIGLFSSLCDRINNCIDERAKVRDYASEKLGHLRKRIQAARGRIDSEIESVMKSPQIRGILQYNKFTIRQNRYVLPIKAEHKSSLDGLVHGTSDSGATLYMEPMSIVELGNELARLVSEEEEEVKRILRELTGMIAESGADILRVVNILGIIDFIHAKAAFSRAYRMSEPIISKDYTLRVRQARHPILLHLSEHSSQLNEPPQDPASVHKPRTVVPTDFRIGDDFDIMIITGPNTGGKTVVLKTVGLLCLMAQSGLHVPAADRSQFPVFSQIHADIGDEQSIEQSLSTFSSHVSQIAKVLSSADSESLVLLDELGAGTDPAEGAALGKAILDKLREADAKTLITTHIGSLKNYAFSYDRVENASVEFDVETLRPTYKLTIGAVGKSNALVIAERLGMTSEVISRASDHMDGEDAVATEMMESVQRAKEEAEEARKDARTLKLTYQSKLAELNHGKYQEDLEIRGRMTSVLQTLHERARKNYRELRYTHKAAANTAKEISDITASEFDRLISEEKEKSLIEKLKEHDEVYVPRFDQNGIVVSVDKRKKRVKLRFDDMEIEVAEKDIANPSTGA